MFPTPKCRVGWTSRSCMSSKYSLVFTSGTRLLYFLRESQRCWSEQTTLISEYDRGTIGWVVRKLPAGDINYKWGRNPAPCLLISSHHLAAAVWNDLSLVSFSYARLSDSAASFNLSGCRGTKGLSFTRNWAGHFSPLYFILFLALMSCFVTGFPAESSTSSNDSRKCFHQVRN